MCVSSEVEHVCGKRKEESRDEDIASIIIFFSVIHFFLLIPTQARGPKRHGQCFTCDFFLYSNFAGFPHTQARGHASRGHWFCRFTWDFFSCHSFFPCFFSPTRRHGDMRDEGQGGLVRTSGKQVHRGSSARPMRHSGKHSPLVVSSTKPCSS